MFGVLVHPLGQSAHLCVIFKCYMCQCYLFGFYYHEFSKAIDFLLATILQIKNVGIIVNILIIIIKYLY